MSAQKKGNGHRLAHHFHKPPERLVSLVPSMTESLFQLGFGSAVVGITDYCTQPEGQVEGLPHLGGPKTPRVAEIIGLEPDLVLANWEENTQASVEALEAAGIRVWVTFPKSVRQALDILWTLAGLFQSGLAAARVESLEIGLEWAQKAAQNRTHIHYFCPIWFEGGTSRQAWWMTFNSHTYAHDLLYSLGAENLFAGRERRYPLDADLGLAEPQDPGERDTRYPRLVLEEIRLSDPELILLPDEPFAFSKDHLENIKEVLSDTRAVRNDRVRLFDGSLITWHGTRLSKALQVLPELLE
jgi:ABC-type Fe3+-hydroxamate transport system substrate-binding protein